MRFWSFILVIFICSCDNRSSESFNSLSQAFTKWYYKNNPVESTKMNFKNYHGNYKMNSYKDSEQYLLDLNKFYFELTQINSSQMNEVHQNEYDRLEKFILKLLYQEEDVKSSHWNPTFKIIEIDRGLRYILNYNYLSMESKMNNLDSRLEKISQLLDNSLTTLFFISENDYNQSVKNIDSIIELLNNIDVNIDSKNDSYDKIIDKTKKVVSRLKLYKKELKGVTSDSENSNKEYIINNDSFSIMTEFDVDINSTYNSIIKNLKNHQIKLFNKCLPIWVDDHGYEPTYSANAYGFLDTLEVIDYVINEVIPKQNKINSFSYVEDSYEKNISPEFDYIKFNYYNDISDFSYLDEELDIITPFDIKDGIQINLPKDTSNSSLLKPNYNKIEIDLLNSYNIYPGYLYLFYSKNEPFDDLNSNGEWDEGESFTDLNNNNEYDNINPVVKSFPNISMLKGAQRYAERIFVKTSKNSSKQHEILHDRNLIVDMLSCMADIDYHLNKKEIEYIDSTLRQNSFLHDIEISNLIDRLQSNYFGYLSQKYIGYTNIMDLEKVYFDTNNKKYLEFYDNIFKYGILDYENLEVYLED